MCLLTGINSTNARHSARQRNHHTVGFNRNISTACPVNTTFATGCQWPCEMWYSLRLHLPVYPVREPQCLCKKDYCLEKVRVDNPDSYYEFKCVKKPMKECSFGHCREFQTPWERLYLVDVESDKSPQRKKPYFDYTPCYLY